MIDVSLTDKTLNVDDFNFIPKDKYPFCFIGQPIRNKYDQERVQYDKFFKPINIIHATANTTPALKFFKGIEIFLKPEYNTLVQKLEALNLNVKDSISLNTYDQILKEFNVSCSECSLFLEKGVYPVNGTDLEKIAFLDDEQLNLVNLYKYNSGQVHFSQAVSSNNIFILSNRNIYNFDSEKIIEIYKKNNFSF
jgi:hypothetical protein